MAYNVPMNLEMRFKASNSPDEVRTASNTDAQNETLTHHGAQFAKTMITYNMVFNSVSQIASTAIGTIGEATGNRPLQRKVEKMSQMSSLAMYGFANPAFAVASLATQLIGETIQRGVTKANEERNRDYFLKLYSSKHNSSRR